ncbi:MAG TPA: glycosyltransferase family 2 protein [Nevskiales bacterium]|nr:glycosyltransferase family 2 protein [Nevskiales bacterium]
MTAQPLVSVILPTHNRATMLGRAIRSVLAQTYRNLELLVVDDNSTDDTESVVRRIQDPRLRYMRLSENRRAAAARNIGIREARGDLIAFQDDDDVWLIEKLARQVPALMDAGPEVGLNLCGKIRLFPDRAEYVGGSKAFARLDFERGGPLDGFMLISTPGWLVRREALLQAGLFDEDMRAWDDWELALRLTRICRFNHIDYPLYLQNRIEGSSMWKNERAFSNDLQIILHKNPGLWQQHRQVLSRNYYYMGRSELTYHDSSRGRRWLCQALRYQPWNFKAAVMLLVSLGGAPAARRLLQHGRSLKMRLAMVIAPLRRLVT